LLKRRAIDYAHCLSSEWLWGRKLVARVEEGPGEKIVDGIKEFFDTFWGEAPMRIDLNESPVRFGISSGGNVPGILVESIPDSVRGFMGRRVDERRQPMEASPSAINNAISPIRIRKEEKQRWRETMQPVCHE
jgi:hypothetical protein